MTDIPINISVSSAKAEEGLNRISRSLQDIRRAAAETNSELTRSGATIAKSTSEGVEGLNRMRSASERASGAINKVNSGTRSTVDALTLLKRGLVTLGIANVSRSFLDLSNTFLELKNRINLVSNSAGEAGRTLNSLFEISNKSRARVDETVSLFQKISIAQKELGATEASNLRFVESISKAIAIQGGATASTSGALLQLSQALTSGIVRAQEFNSILEGAFPIAKLAAEGIDRAGGSVGRLRTLVIEGKISSREFFEAILKQSSEVDAAFEKMTPTISSAVNVLRNQFIKSLSTAEPLLNVLANSILFVSENLEIFINLAGVVLAGASVSMVKAVGEMGKSLVLAFSNPLTLIVSATAALVLFTRNLQISKDTTVTFGQVAVVVFENVASKIKTLTQLALGYLEKIKTKISQSGIYNRISALFARDKETNKVGFGQVSEDVFKPKSTFESISDYFSGAVYDAEQKNMLSGSMGQINYGENLADSVNPITSSFDNDNFVNPILNSVEQVSNGINDKLGVSAIANPVKDSVNEIEASFFKMEDNFEAVTSNMENYLLDFIETGKFNFKDFIDSVIMDLAKLAIQNFGNTANSYFSSNFGSQSGGGGTDWVGMAASAIGTFFGGSFSQGIDYVPRDMVGTLHKGEKVVPANENKKGSDQNNITINYVMPNVTDYNSFNKNKSQLAADTARILNSSLRRNG